MLLGRLVRGRCRIGRAPPLELCQLRRKPCLLRAILMPGFPLLRLATTADAVPGDDRDPGCDPPRGGMRQDRLERPVEAPTEEQVAEEPRRKYHGMNNLAGAFPPVKRPGLGRLPDENSGT
jgi:hypothetical protein